MHVSASFTDHREAERTIRELGEHGIPAELEPLADVDPPLADPVLVRATTHGADDAQFAAAALVHHGGALIVASSLDPGDWDPH
ncbi:MAG TPA: hypothetical protein VFK54_04840 [Candidatus Limnocylindrales bacterium]|nr:hypothetical protein [Candidatus Limnocylindrales bacterium]